MHKFTSPSGQPVRNGRRGCWTRINRNSADNWYWFECLKRPQLDVCCGRRICWLRNPKDTLWSDIKQILTNLKLKKTNVLEISITKYFVELIHSLQLNEKSRMNYKLCGSARNNKLMNGMCNNRPSFENICKCIKNCLLLPYVSVWWSLRTLGWLFIARLLNLYVLGKPI